MYSKEEFVQIKPQYFLKGMYVDSDVFYIRDNKPVLFCKQSVITNEKILKLKTIAECNAPIFVSGSSYEHLIKQYKYLTGTNERQADQFREVKADFGKFYESVKKSGKIETDTTKKLVNVVIESINQAELSFILHWISYMRDSDEYLYTHSVNVGLLNGMMGKWMNFSKIDREKLVLTGLIHDLGKTKIPDEVLHKPARLTKEEFEIIKNHTIYSYEILKDSQITDEAILMGARGHHEKSNGSGYPDKLKLDEIPLFAKITSISDVYDAMVAKRVYKEARTPFEVLDELYQNRFSDLDIRLVDIFLNNMANEMIGKEVVLTNGKVAKIVFVEKSNFAYPVVQYEDNFINTSKELRCEALCSEAE